MLSTFREYYAALGRHELQAILFDVDGTLASGAKPLPYAAELLRILHADGMPFFLLTNDSCTAPEVKARRLVRNGIPVEPANVISCAHTLPTAIMEQGWQARRFYVNGSLGTPSYADAAGLQWTDNPDELPQCDAIIIGEGDYEWKRSFEAMFNHLLAYPDTPVIVPNPDSYWPRVGGQGELGVGAGGIARFLFQLLSEKGIAVKPLYLGKPYPMIYRHTVAVLRKLLGVAPEMSRIAMIGDSLASDIRGGNTVGMRTMLVLTGITSAVQLVGIPPEITPQMVFATL